jgi:tetratricopeptide (TPR) repeat protein
MSTPSLRPYLLIAALILLGGSKSPLHAQEDFKGARPANPPVNHRSPTPNPNGKASRRTGGKQPTTDLSEKVEEAIELGNKARDAEDYAEAEKQYKRALSFNSREARAYYGLGNLYKDKWKTNSGELSTNSAEEFEKSLQAYKENVTGTYKGVIPEEAAHAIQAYQQAIRLKPDYAEAFYNLGNIYQALGRLTEAAAQYSRAISFKPYDDPSNRMVTTYTPNKALAFTYFLLNRYTEAIEQQKQIVRHDPDYSGYEILALMYETQNRWAEAIETEQQAIRLSPNNSRPYYRLGLTYHAQQRYAEAIEQYKSAIQHSASPHEILGYYYNLGLAYVKSRDKDGAMEQYRMLRKKSEEFAGYEYLREDKKRADGFADTLLQEINKQ